MKLKDFPTIGAPPLPRRRSKLRKEPLSSEDLPRPEPGGLGELKRSAHSAEPSAHFERSPSVSWSPTFWCALFPCSLKHLLRCWLAILVSVICESVDLLIC